MLVYDRLGGNLTCMTEVSNANEVAFCGLAMYLDRLCRRHFLITVTMFVSGKQKNRRKT